MNSLRALCHTVVISLCFSLGLLHLAPAGASAAFTGAVRHLVLLPFGILCPLFGAGCLLHDLLERNNLRGTRFISAAGVLLACLAAGLLIWFRMR